MIMNANSCSSLSSKDRFSKRLLFKSLLVIFPFFCATPVFCSGDTLNPATTQNQDTTLDQAREDVDNANPAGTPGPQQQKLAETDGEGQDGGNQAEKKEDAKPKTAVQDTRPAPVAQEQQDDTQTADGNGATGKQKKDDKKTKTPEIIKYSNKKSGSMDIGLHIGCQGSIVGIEVEGGIGINFGKGNYEKPSEGEAQEFAFKQNALYYYVTPKGAVQISKFLLKVGPRFQFGSLGHITEKEKNVKTFNIGLQVEALFAINNNIATGLKVVWSPSMRMPENDQLKDHKYGDFSIALCFSGQYKHSGSGFYVGCDISCGYKMSTVKMPVNTPTEAQAKLLNHALDIFGGAAAVINSNTEKLNEIDSAKQVTTDSPTENK